MILPEDPSAPRKKQKLKAPQLEAQIIKEINQNKQMSDVKEFQGLKNPQHRRLILTRNLGHRVEMPSGHKWVLRTTAMKGCWVCDKEVFSLIFWNLKVGKEAKH